MLFDGKNQNKNSAIEETIQKIKDGDSHLRETFIRHYGPFILKVASNTIGKFVEIENHEEYSIALSAFNEAINRYDPTKGASFLSFASQVIKRRVIDLVRSNQSGKKVYPFTYFESEYDTGFEERYLTNDHLTEFESVEIRQEIELFERSLKEFDISLKDLANSSPKHKDSKLFSIKIAKVISDNEEMFKKLMKNKKIPVSELVKEAGVNERTVERNRKFIIAVALLLRSKHGSLKGYVDFSREGGKPL